MNGFDWLKSADRFRPKNKGKAAAPSDDDDDDDDLPRPTAVSTPAGGWLPALFASRKLTQLFPA